MTVEQYLQKQMGVTLPQTGHIVRMTCPFHGGSRSNFMYDRSKDVFTCFSDCKTTGGVLDAIRLHRKFPKNSENIKVEYKRLTGEDWVPVAVAPDLLQIQYDAAIDTLSKLSVGDKELYKKFLEALSDITGREVLLLFEEVSKI